MSSGTSTDEEPPEGRALAVSVAGGGSPALARITPARLHLAVVGGLAVVPAGIGLAVLYGGGLTAAGGMLALGWASLVATGYLLYRAALSFDLTERDPLAAGAAGELSDRERLDLEREKKLLLKAIKEIEFDHAMGKLDDRDAGEVTRRYRQRAVEIIRALDEHQGLDYQVTVEKELGKRLAKAGLLAAAAGDPTASAAAPVAREPEAPVVAAPSLKPEVETRSAAPPADACATCGLVNDTDAVFCKKCGARLSS